MRRREPPDVGSAGKGTPAPPPGVVPRAGLPVLDDGRLYGFGAHIPAGKAAKGARRAARKVEAGYRKQLMQARKDEIAAANAERASSGFMPRPGDPGPKGGRSWRRLKVTPHRATSEILAGAYPFLAEEGLGSDGTLIGQDAWSGTAFCFDPWELYRQKRITNPNIFLAGQIGRGKSTLAKALATRYIAFGRRVYVPGDPKGEWSIVTRAAGGQVIALGGGRPTRLNPLDPGRRPADMPDDAWKAKLAQDRLTLLSALAETTVGRPLAPVERTALDAALDSACAANTVPIVPMVVDALHTPTAPYAGSTVDQLRADGRDVAHALGRLIRGDLAGLFDGPSTVRFDASLPMMSLDLSDISGSDTLIGLVMTCASAWLEAELRDPSGGQRLVVYDEAWRLLAQPSLLARMQAHWKLSRAWGLANLMVVHRLSDFEAVGDKGSAVRGLAQGLLADTATRILYNQPTDEANAAGTVLGLTSTQTRQLPDLAQGEGLWRINERAFVVRHICTNEELALFDTDARMLSV